MAFYGKVFTSKIGEHKNMEEFLKAAGVPDALIQGFTKSESTIKLTKNGDSYTLISTGPRDTENTFTNGGEYEEKINDQLSFKSKMEVDGNVLTQTQKGNDGRVIVIRREFTDDALTEKLTLAGWDGVAYRYFKA